MHEIVDLTKGIVERVKTFEEDDSVARQTDILSPTDKKPLLETLRGYKSQDGELMIYKVIGNRKMQEAEVRELAEKGQIGPLDGFRSKAGKPFSAMLKIDPEKKKAVFQFDGQRDASGAFKIDFTGLQPISHAPAKFGAGAQVYETPQSYVIRVQEGAEDKVPVRVSRKILGRDIPREQFFKLLETGKTDLLDKFWSQSTRRPFNAYLVLQPDGKTTFEFEPRKPKDPNAPKRRKFTKKAAADSAPPADS